MNISKIFIAAALAFLFSAVSDGFVPSASDASEALTVKLGTIGPEEGTDVATATREFINGVEADSNGEIKFDYYTNGALGGDFDMAEMCAQGTLQMCQPSFGVMSSYNPKFGVVDMPFLFNSPGDVIKALAGDFGNEIKKLYEGTGLLCLGLSYGGGRGMTNSKRPITAPADMKGLKMRVMESPTYIEMFKLFGANPTPLSFSELFTALQNGTVDGQDNDPSLVYVAQFYEVQKYFTATNHVYAINSMVVNENFWSGLSDEHKKIISENTQKYLVDHLNELCEASGAEYIRKLADKGMEITAMTDENRNAFRKAAEPLYETQKDKFGDLVEIAQKIK
ncbi:MAG: TRAP transporter substrate-binding protein [Synergistaceae bacterium]|jgi:tripartite ATP-independent transporter DctP family solute receptor|nr:TRAP transporter substrate-binding protein [Synergistaceae bacterium]